MLAVTWRATYTSLYGPQKVEELIAAWHAPERIREHLARPEGEYLIADDGTELGGMAYATMSGQDDIKTIRLHQLYVHPGHQRQGIGRDLFADIETCFPGARRLVVEVDPNNGQAIAFYRGVGMTEAGRIDDCGTPGSGIPAILMEKELPAGPDASGLVGV
nr:GNAT family N-acetyltransferase [Pseudohoeflea sp. DP4N28-3]